MYITPTKLSTYAKKYILSYFFTNAATEVDLRTKKASTIINYIIIANSFMYNTTELQILYGN